MAHKGDIDGDGTVWTEDDEEILVPKAWLESLFKWANKAKDNKQYTDLLIGFASSAETLIKCGRKK